MRAVFLKRLCAAVALAGVTGVVSPAGETTLIRQSLADLVAANALIVVGEVVEVDSRWNEGQTFILSDARITVRQVLKGNLKSRELTVTLMGGSLGELNAHIVGGADLRVGNSYLLLLNRQNLPGARDVRTVRDLSQGAFDIVLAEDGLRAVSQANRMGLVPDARGEVEPPGGKEGFPLAAMMQSIRELVERPSRREVK